MSSSGRNTMALVFPALDAEQHREPFGTNPLAVDGHSTPLAGVSCLLVEGDHDAAKDAASSAPASSHGDETLSPNESLAFGIATRYQLTPRQRQVLTLLIAGSPPKKIAECLAISAPTMRRHAEELYRKCGVRSQRELLALVARSTATARLA
jgi:DNA-binding CsgD family transcriptional regulator